MRLLVLLMIVISGCAVGTTTTTRPALNKPVIGPDGTFEDAIEAARRGDTVAMRFLLSPRFIHEALLPTEKREDPQKVEEFDKERLRLEKQLAPHEATVQRLLRACVKLLNDLTQNRFVEAGRPSYDIRLRDDFDRAFGPNKASMVVQTWPKGALGPDPKPQAFTLHFVQDRQRWLIDDMDPNPLKGAFTR
ncbi:MAG: hypothetical protein KF754_05465 [Planctomycetes bacterium]|nr:hypothetical protein [Planctomycetota bacterium]